MTVYALVGAMSRAINCRRPTTSPLRPAPMAKPLPFNSPFPPYDSPPPQPPVTPAPLSSRRRLYLISASRPPTAPTCTPAESRLADLT
eukprot:scaffold16117_cov90-Isochrysis_galbana.AAC.1